jgi:hypothetical protein
MKRRYIRNQAMALLLCISFLEGHEQENPTDLGRLGRLHEKIMRSWSEINIARAISPYNAEAFYQRIIKAHLELYEVLCTIASEGNFLSHELAPLYRTFKGLCVSHDSWCTEQKPTTTIGAYYLMIAIMQIWCFAAKGALPPSLEQSVNLLEHEEYGDLGHTAP